MSNRRLAPMHRTCPCPSILTRPSIAAHHRPAAHRPGHRSSPPTVPSPWCPCPRTPSSVAPLVSAFGARQLVVPAAGGGVAAHHDDGLGQLLMHRRQLANLQVDLFRGQVTGRDFPYVARHEGHAIDTPPASTSHLRSASRNPRPHGPRDAG